ncbi:MAG TPA: helix-turn-helix domain-containing protein [Candidatus Limnocylindrales bacterium]|jgi:excisionase family DNA binding protein
MDRVYYTPKEIAELLRISDDAVLDLIRRDEIPALRVSSRIIRIPAAGFDAWREGRGPVRRRVRIAALPGEKPAKIGEGEELPDRALSLRR